MFRIDVNIKVVSICHEHPVPLFSNLSGHDMFQIDVNVRFSSVITQALSSNVDFAICNYLSEHDVYPLNEDL
jgi:hypothetical protein